MKDFKENRIMMYSNIFLALPVIFAGIYEQWLYLFFASGLLMFSPLFHLYRIKNPASRYYFFFRKMDWSFAFGAFFYMYFYVYQYIKGNEKYVFYTLLFLVILFFWYGYKKGDYEKLHPYFHIIAPIVSSAILLIAHIHNT